MQIVHFDVDSEIAKYLSGPKVHTSINQDFSEDMKFAECISIKIGSQADKKTLEKFPDLKLLVTRTVGVDHIDLDYCFSRGVTVQNIPDYGAFNIAEHAFAMLLYGCRNIASSQLDVKSGNFTFEGHLSYALKGKKIGVVGTGRIGLEMIKRAKGFEMEVLAFDIHKKEEAAIDHGFRYVSLEELLKNVDILSLHAPATTETHHLITSKELELMKSGSIILNTARGDLINTEALIKNIKKFRFVGLDVLENEKNFDMNNPLLKFENVLITPHMAFYSDLSVKEIARETNRLIEEYLLEKQG